MLAISMRIAEIQYQSGDIEKRDSLARDWFAFLRNALPGRALLPAPNIGKDAVTMLASLPVKGLILSGGEDWGINAERDETEKLLFEYACQNNWPILGVCRGAQVINRLFGGKAESGYGKLHAGKRHAINILPNPYLKTASLEVNSYHGNAIQPRNLGMGLRIMAEADDGSVEAFFAPARKIAGVLWHPEREKIASAHDIYMMNRLFGELEQ